MTSTVSAYLPLDRRRALALGQTLPDRMHAEARTRQLDWIYDALIAEVERYAGSVVGFTGDVISCCFDESGAGSCRSSQLVIPTQLDAPG